MTKHLDAITSTQKASAETAMALMKSSLDTIERLAALNLNTMREAIEASSSQANKLMSAQDLAHAKKLQEEAAQPGVERTRTYYHQVYELMTEMQEQLTKVMQAHYNAMSESAATVSRNISASAPAGGEAFATAMKTMLDSSSKTFERLNEMSHQLQANTKEAINTVSNEAPPPVSATAKAAKASTTRSRKA